MSAEFPAQGGQKQGEAFSPILLNCASERAKKGARKSGKSKDVPVL
jgi:hypothetical protein